MPSTSSSDFFNRFRKFFHSLLALFEIVLRAFLKAFQRSPDERNEGLIIGLQRLQRECAESIPELLSIVQQIEFFARSFTFFELDGFQVRPVAHVTGLTSPYSASREVSSRRSACPEGNGCKR